MLFVKHKLMAKVHTVSNSNTLRTAFSHSMMHTKQVNRKNGD